MSNRRKAIALCPCADCGMFTVMAGRPPEWYMVRDDVWAAAGMPVYAVRTGTLTEILCTGCLEARLGRELTAAGFTSSEDGDPARTRMTPRLADRVARPPARPLTTRRKVLTASDS